jgi:hypothetical protein
MKDTNLKTGLMTITCTVLMLAANIASAHEFGGALTNGLLSGTAGGATDVYTVQCFQDGTEPSQQPSDHLFIQVSDNNPAGGQISAIALSPQGKAITITDLTPGDGMPSAGKALKLTPASLNATFTILIHHTAPASDSYQLSYHCEDANNQHTGTSETPTALQNQ